MGVVGGAAARLDVQNQHPSFNHPNSLLLPLLD
jgi:hypothetical protein